ncbi:hypothetical protein AAMO2058_001596200 [Amorphochlora amoebiformis]
MSIPGTSKGISMNLKKRERERAWGIPGISWVLEILGDYRRRPGARPTTAFPGEELVCWISVGNGLESLPLHENGAAKVIGGSLKAKTRSGVIKVKFASYCWIVRDNGAQDIA